MSASKCCPERVRPHWRFAAALLLAAAPGHAQSAVGAELTALFDSGNLLRGPEPSPPVWEGLASLRSGREQRARLGLTRADVGLLPGVTTLALLRLELGLDAVAQGAAPVIRDASSFVGVNWQVAPDVKLGLRAFPFDTDYLRLGYLHALDWGGTDVTRRESVFLQQTGGAPGVELSLRLRRLRLFSALKWASLPNLLGAQQRLWGALSGGHFELAAPLTLDVGFGYFQRPQSAVSSFVEGASLRLVWHRGAAEPELADEPFRAPSLREDPERLSAADAAGFALAVEAVTLIGAGRRYDRPNERQLSAAPAAAIYGSVRGDRVALHAAFVWRSLPFVLRNEPSATVEASELNGAAKPELGAWAGASLTHAPLQLVPSVELGVRLPAALEVPSGLGGFSQTLVVGGPAGLEALPVGAGRLPVLAGRVGVRLQASASVALACFTEYARDPNRTSFVASPAGVTRSFAPPDSLAFFAASQARF